MKINIYCEVTPFLNFSKDFSKTNTSMLYIKRLLITVSWAPLLISSVNACFDKEEKSRNNNQIITQPSIRNLSNNNNDEILSDQIERTSNNGSSAINNSFSLTSANLINFCERITKESNKLKNLADSEKWDAVLNLANERDLTPPIEFLKRGTLVQSYFNYIYAVSQSYQGKAKNVGDLEAIEYYNQSINYCEKYIETIKLYDPQGEENRMGMQACNKMIYDQLGDANLRLFIAHIRLFPTANNISYIWKALLNFQKTISSDREARMLNEEYSTVVRNINAACKLKIFECYTALIVETPNNDLKDNLFEKARKFLPELKEDKLIYKLCVNSIQLLEKEFNAQKLQEKSGRIGDKVRSKLIQKYRGEAAKISSELVDKDATDLNSWITVSYSQFLMLSSGDKHEENLAILESIENKTLGTLQLQADFIIQDEKEKFKEIYKYIFNVQSVVYDINKIMLCFLNNNKVDDALIRAQAIQELDSGKSAEVSWPLKIWIAFLKNLTGDYKEWLAIEDLANQNQHSKRLNHKAQEKEKHKKHVMRIQKNINEKTAQEHKSLPEKQLIRSIKTDEVPREDEKTLDHPNAFFNDSLPSDAELRLAKVKRHEEKIKQRQKEIEQDKRDIRNIISQEPQASTKELLPSFTIQENQPLSPEFNLKGLALAVEQEINNNEWKFDRDQLRGYFEALGCTYKPGKGSHSKIQLPETLHVMFDNKFITIFNNEGGALTLPKWKENVPYYLRKQILIARKKINDLKMNIH